MGWQFPVSTYNTDFGLALTEEQAQQVPEIKEMIDSPPDELQREGDRLPHLHGDGARPVRQAVLQLPARANAENPTRRAPRLAEGRVPGLTPIGRFAAE
jgi:hypothetical protein